MSPTSPTEGLAFRDLWLRVGTCSREMAIAGPEVVWPPRGWFSLTMVGLLLGAGIALVTTRLANGHHERPSSSRSTPSVHSSRRREPDARDGVRALPWAIPATPGAASQGFKPRSPGPLAWRSRRSTEGPCASSVALSAATRGAR